MRSVSCTLLKNHMPNSRFRVAALAVCVAVWCAVSIAEERPAVLSEAQVDAALRIASDEDATRVFLDVYRLQSRVGAQSGPLLGWLSTPFSRLVLESRAARKAGHAITRDDVVAKWLYPELMVIALPQPAAIAGHTLARVKEIALATRAGVEMTDVLLPLRMRSLTVQERMLYEMESSGEAVVAVFSFAAAAPMLAARDSNVVLRVTFDKTTKGSTSSPACKDCVVPIADR